jgi:hypothetical protein
MSAAAAIRAKVDSASPGTFIRAGDFDSSRSAVDTALSRLSAARSDLVRVSRGIYWKGVDSRYGPGRPSLLDVAHAAAGNRGVGPTGWTASHVLGLTTQVPAVPELTTVGPVPTRVKDVAFHRRSNANRGDLTFLDIALLEVLRDDLRHVDGGWDALVDRVVELVGTGKLDLGRLARVVITDRSPTARTNFARLRSAVRGR